MRLSFYERACNLSERLLPIKPPRRFEKRLREAIEFSHLRITPRGAVSLVALAALLLICIPTMLALLLGFFSLTFVLLVLLLAAIAFYLLIDYPFHYATVFRIRASGEMVLAIIYMSISMRVSPNLERAVSFAANNLTGPLAHDLRKLLWGVHTRKYLSMEKALSAFTSRWRRENEEFTDAIHLIRASATETPARRERTLDEAVSVVLAGNRERMREYGRKLKLPLTVINALGILLPIIGIIFLPMIGIFLPEAIRPGFIALGYNILLPIVVYLLMRTWLEKRPFTFHQPELKAHPSWTPERLGKPLLLSLLVSLPPIALATWYMGMHWELFSFRLLAYSLLVTCGVTAGFVCYGMLSGLPRLGWREDLIRMEHEFVEASYHLGTLLARGLPVETALRQIVPRIRELRVAGFFKRIYQNIETFGMTLESAVFDPKVGAIKLYPSPTIRAMMQAVIRVSKRGLGYAARTMVTVSRYLKDSHGVEEDTKELLEEVTSTMKLQATLLSPLTAGIAVALAGIMMQMMITLAGAVERMFEQLAGAGVAGAVGAGILGSLINLGQMVPIHVFQLIVGIYTIEIVSLIAIFVSTIEHGEEDILRRVFVSKTLLLAIAVYAFTLMLTFSGISALLPAIGIE